MRTIPQLIALVGFEQLTKADRWQIIDEIEQQIDHLQRCQKVLHDQGVSYANLAQEITELRTKKVLIWLSLSLKTPSLVRLAA
ncbi:hypothetical protein [Spirosoma oryzicola]|uniref:hypothetical protein n=1 Tax=Spirosoma oryzicola TaxID=2898794 RepID=UPI001E31D789|nr:hypothetical protein [Spirosoma oryzicola]UHG93410.1 hypothetical protein LQ777_11010 [Spirosoma oryzicola]